MTWSAHDYQNTIYVHIVREFGITPSDYARGGSNVVHEAINTLCRRADRLASRVADSALNSGCTDTRPTGTRSARAWDMVFVAHEMNCRTGEPLPAWGRKDNEPCQHGTVGCNVYHHLTVVPDECKTQW